MKFFNITQKVSNFLIRRLIELFGLLIVLASIFLLVALLTYAPEDPNFIFPENTIIKNFFGIKGSLVSDLFFQSVGLVSILISLSF